MRPVMFDLFCAQGGTAMGYHRAGFDVIGVDISPQPKYPFEFHQADALEFLGRHYRECDAIHASPPCQDYTALKAVHGNQHPRLIVPTRWCAQGTGKPYIIENVLGSDLLDPVTLCGEQFGLGVIRHRLFETNWVLKPPAHIKHRGRVRGWRHGTYYDGPYVAVYGKGGGKASVKEASEAMGIDWMDADGLREAIPPAYTQYIGTQLIAYLNSQKEAA